MLSVRELVVLYQELRALRGVTIEVTEGDLVALIGSNGAGKTTLLNTISGLIPAAKGQISWQGTPISGLSADEICREGIIQVPEGRKLFAQMTVGENLEMGAYLPMARKHFRESRDRGKVRWALVERMEKKLSKRIESGDLATQ